MNFFSGKFIGFSLLTLLTTLTILIIFNRGVIMVSLEPPFLLDAKGFRRFECSEKICEQKIPSGEREFCISREGFFSTCENLSIPIFGKISWNPTLKKIPTLSENPVLPAEEPRESVSLHLENEFHEWPHITTKFGRFFAFQPETGSLLFFENSEKSSVVSHFETKEIPDLFAFGEKILVKIRGEFFLVDPDSRQKIRLFSGKDPEIKIFFERFLLRDEGNILLFEEPDFVPRDFPILTELSHIAWCENQFFTFFDGDFIRIFSENLVQKNIAAAAITGDFSLECGNEKNSLTILFSDETEKKLSF